MADPSEPNSTRDKSDDENDPKMLQGLFLTKRAEHHLAKPEATANGEFVCRPIRLRLASAGLGVVRRASEDRSSLQNSTHHSEFISDRYSERSSDKSSRMSMLSRLSRRLVSSFQPTAQDNTSSIEIKNVAPPVLRRYSTSDPDGILEMIFAVCLVDFHHAHGPEVLWWRSNYIKDWTPDQNLFRHLPFQALPDGSHLFTETFSNFNLVYDFRSGTSLDDKSDNDTFQGNPNHIETLFGCSCVRQIKTADMSQDEVARNKDITRSIVQKAVVVITRKQPIFTKIKEKLSIITQTYFEQNDFNDYVLLGSLFENLNRTFKLRDDALPVSIKRPQSLDISEDLLREQRYEEQEEYFVNLKLRGILFLFKNDMLVILKALLLEKKVMVYSNNDLELLTQFQNNLIALIPNLLGNLDLCGSPLCDYTEKHSPLQKPTSLKTNDRMSMLRFFGLPLHIFSTKGSFWNPYLPLQQIDELSAESFMVGCSNLMIAKKLMKYQIDLLVNLDDSTVLFPTGKGEDLKLSQMDKKFMSVLLSTTQNEDAYVGSDDYIRYQFEDYVRSLLATTKYYQYVEKFKNQPPGFDSAVDMNPENLKSFGSAFVERWSTTKNYEIWNAQCDDLIFNFHPPVHTAARLSSGVSGYLSGLFSSFKKTKIPFKLSDKAVLYFSHQKEPQKFIPDEEQEPGKEAKNEAKSEQKSYWNWDFKQ